MADQDYRARIVAIAKQLSDLKTGLQPVATQQAALQATTVISLWSELALLLLLVCFLHERHLLLCYHDSQSCDRNH